MHIKCVTDALSVNCIYHFNCVATENDGKCSFLCKPVASNSRFIINSTQTVYILNCKVNIRNENILIKMITDISEIRLNGIPGFPGILLNTALLCRSCVFVL